MKSAFFIFILLLPLSLTASTFTIANQQGKVRSINIINHRGVQYSDFEYTTSCIVGDIKSDSNSITFDGKQLEATPNAKFILYSLYSQIIAEQLSSPVLILGNRVCVPLRDYVYALDSLGICKVVASQDGYFKIDDYDILRNVPIITNLSNKFNLAYFEQVYKEINSTIKPKLQQRKVKVHRADKTLELLKDAMKGEKSELPISPNNKEEYYDLPRGLNRDAILKKKN